MVFIHYIRILSSVNLSMCDVLLHHFRKCYYSAFEVPCPDRDLKSALDHVAVINERHDSSFRIRNSNCVSNLCIQRVRISNTK